MVRRRKRDEEQTESDDEDYSADAKRPAAGNAGGRFSGRLATKDDELKLHQECFLLSRYLGGPEDPRTALTTLARIVRAIAKGDVRRQLEAQDSRLQELENALGRYNNPMRPYQAVHTVPPGMMMAAAPQAREERMAPYGAYPPPTSDHQARPSDPHGIDGGRIIAVAHHQHEATTNEGAAIVTGDGQPATAAPGDEDGGREQSAAPVADIAPPHPTEPLSPSHAPPPHPPHPPPPTLRPLHPSHYDAPPPPSNPPTSYVTRPSSNQYDNPPQSHPRISYMVQQQAPQGTYYAVHSSAPGPGGQGPMHVYHTSAPPPGYSSHPPPPPGLPGHPGHPQTVLMPIMQQQQSQWPGMVIVPRGSYVQGAPPPQVLLQSRPGPPPPPHH